MNEGTPPGPGQARQFPGAPHVEGLELVGELGRGGMGVVYRARDLAAGRDVALKLVLGQTPSPRQLERFEREGRLTAGLVHPGIVRVHSAGVVRGAPYLVYELVDGAQDLSGLLPQLSRRRKLELIREAAVALGFAHGQGIVHRDVKPENVLVDAAGRARVADFGLAFDMGQCRITATHEMLGTPLYMSPEQLSAKRDEQGPPTDVWSLGVMLYEALVGEVPFNAGSLVELHSMVLGGPVTSPRKVDPTLPESLEQIVLCCLQRDPSARYPSATELVADLDSYLQGEDVAAPRRGLRWVRWVAAAVVLCAVGAAFALRPAPKQPAAARSQAPWGAWAPGWTPVWELGADEGVEHPLWKERARVAAPLERVLAGDAQALRAAYPWGEARLEDGVVVVRYQHLSPALRNVSRVPGELLALFPPQALFPPDEGAEVELLCPNDSGKVTLRLGDARWVQPRIACDVRQLGPGDMQRFGLWVGDGEVEREVFLNGRTGRIGTEGGSVPFRIGEVASRLSFSPGAPLGKRVAFGADWAEELEAGQRPLSGAADVGFWVSEHHVRASGFEVAGVPLRPDAGAFAWPPPTLGAAVSLRASFERTLGGDGGPALALGDGSASQGVVLELRGAALLLRHGAQTLKRIEVGGEPLVGWLELTRVGQRVRGSLHTAGREVSLDVFDPRPLPIVRAAYGSTAPRVAFAHVEVAEGSAQAEPLTASWRAAAWRLLQLTSLEYADRSLVGRAQAAARREEARGIGAALREVAADERASPGLRADARARATLAAVLASEGAQAEEAAARLVVELGQGRALEAVNQLCFLGDDPCGLALLKRGWVGRNASPAIQEAALRAHDVLLPQDPEVPMRRAQAHVVQGRSLRDREQRAGFLRRALELCADARARGLEAGAVIGVESECLFELGRYSEAADAWRQAVVRRPDWYGCMRLAQCLVQLRDWAGAIEYALRAAARTRRSPKQAVGSLLFAAAQGAERGFPGHAAVAYQVLGEVWPAAANGERVRLLSARVIKDPRPVEFELALYLEVREGRGVILPPGGGPTSALAAAHRHLKRGDVERARALVVDACLRSALVRALASLDPKLGPFVPPER